MKNCQLKLKMSRYLLKAKVCKRFSHSGRWICSSSSILRGRGGQWSRQRDEALQGAQKLIRPPQDIEDLGGGCIQEEQEHLDLIQEHTIQFVPLKPQNPSHHYPSPFSLPFSVSSSNKAEHAPFIILLHLSHFLRPAVWLIAKSSLTLQWKPHPPSTSSTALMCVKVCVSVYLCLYLCGREVKMALTTCVSMQFMSRLPRPKTFGLVLLFFCSLDRHSCHC